MTDNTEPTIDKIIDELLAEAIEKAITEWAGQEYPNDATFYDVTVKEAKQAIKALIANQVAKARIDELIGVRGWTEYEPDPKYSPAERFHIVPYTYLTKRIEELKRSNT